MIIKRFCSYSYVKHRTPLVSYFEKNILKDFSLFIPLFIPIKNSTLNVALAYPQGSWFERILVYIVFGCFHQILTFLAKWCLRTFSLFINMFKKLPKFWPHITRWWSAQATAFLTKWFLRRSFYKTNLYFYLKTHASLRPYPWELCFVQTCICTICKCFTHIFFKFEQNNSNYLPFNVSVTLHFNLYPLHI